MEKIDWRNNQTPALNATNLNAMQDNIEDAIDEKQDTLVSGTNIKTINNTSLIGSGNINVEVNINDSYSTSTTQPYSCNYVNEAARNSKYYTLLEENTNLNTIVDYGTYRSVSTAYTSTMTNVPSGVTGGFTIYVVGWTSTNATATYIRQELIYGEETYIRKTSDSGSTWSDWEHLITDKVTTGTGIITKTSGNSTIESSTYFKCGKVVTLNLSLTGTASTSAGSNWFVGQISDSSLYPPISSVYGVAYYGSSNIIMAINSSGKITVRITGASLASDASASISITYIVQS